MSDQLTHLDEHGRAHMVDVSAKAVSERSATAQCWVQMQPETLQRILDGNHPKGDVLAVARIAGIQAAKRTSELIPLCHPLMLTSVKVALEPCLQSHRIRVEATCKVTERTGVEMEALTAASVAALTLYDMCKAVDRGMRIDGLALLEKCGGRSGHWVREEA